MWHRFRHVTPGYPMTDPNKLTLLTPGFDRATGEYADYGIPAPGLAQHLRENRIVAGKNDLNSILFLLTPGVEPSKAGTLLSALVFFTRLHDANVPLEEVIPEFVRVRPQRFAGVRLRDLCRQMHLFYRGKDNSRLQRRQFRPQAFSDPRRASACGRAGAGAQQRRLSDARRASGPCRATTLWVVSPPGIATIVPGELLDDRAQPMIDYLKVFEQGSNLFPDLETEIQGVYHEKQADGSMRFLTYVIR